MQTNLTRKPIEIRISTVVAVAVILNDASLTVLESALREMTGGTHDFFDDEFAVLDVASIADQKLDWKKLIPLFKAHGLNPVAVRNSLDKDHAAITQHGLSIDVVSKPHHGIEHIEEAQELQATISPAPASALTPAAPQPAPEPQIIIQHLPAMIVDTPVRAGQRIYARGADLIITAAVNNGAEVIADGSIHIYGPLRGRALAGATGNALARIFALTMEPELVSIAGTYRTFENGFPSLLPHCPVQVKLIGDSIEVSSIKSPN